MNLPSNRIPVTILTGFLGAGKTTMLNALIKNNGGKKIAVIENEFGATNIDSELIIGVKENVFELSNGCMCCSLNGELLDTLHTLLEKTGAIDHLILETTGVADPGPIILSFLSDYAVQASFRLDAVICLVDVQFIEQQLEREEEPAKQLAVADIIVINKMKEVDTYQQDTVQNIIKRINPQAIVYTSDYGIVAGIELLGSNTFGSLSGIEDSMKPFIKAKKNTDILGIKPDHREHSNLSFAPNALAHTIAISSHYIEFPEALDLIKFDLWMSMVLNENSGTIYRIKGILHVHDIPHKMIFQSVSTQFITTSGDLWAQEASHMTRLVVIGKQLQTAALEKGLAQCIYTGRYSW